MNYRSTGDYKSFFNNTDTKNIFESTNDGIIYGYLILTSLIEEINTIVRYYIDGNFLEIINYINSGKNTIMANKLNTIKKNAVNLPDIKFTANFYLTILNSLTQHINQYTKLQISNEITEIFKKDAAILNTPTLLKAYIENLKKNLRALPDLFVETQAPTIKQEYLTYIELYGFPKNGIFDIGLLAQIIEDQNNT